MAPMEGACEECTQRCIMMHKKDRNPAEVATTFFKVMIGKDYDKVLFLPPKFACSLTKEVPKSTWLEDSSGERWEVKISNIDGSMAFRKGWNEFALDHWLEVGDLLVFHYIKKSHFVVLMYGKSGCSELRHQMKTPKKNNKLILDDRGPSNVNSNGKHCLNESSSEFECSRQKKKRSIKENDAMVPPDGNTTKTDHLAASLSQPGTPGSDIERGQRSEPLVIKTNGDTMVCETQIATSGPDKEMSQRCEPLVCKTGTPVEQFCKLANVDANVDDDYRKTMPKVNPNSMSRRCEPLVCQTGTTVKQFCKLNNNDASLDDEYRKIKPKVNPEESEGARKSKVEAGGSGEETQNDVRKRLETKLEAKRKTSTAMPSETTRSNSKKQMLQNSNVTFACAKTLSPSTRDFLKPAKHMEMLKKEPVTVKETNTSGSRFRIGGNPSPSTGFFPKPTANRMEGIKKEPTTDYDLGGQIRTFSGSKLKDTKKEYCNSLKVENDIDFVKVKPEPVDDDEAPPSGPSNTTFSAVMNSYKYIELPDKVKLKKVIFLRNGSDLWPVLFQSKFGLKALADSWEVFAKERGIMPGDKCYFVLESDPTKDVFSVHISR